jgi:predicted amidohydrolase
LIAFYAKMRPFAPGGEAEHYVAGEHPVTFPWAELTVAPFVCYDLRFPEIFRAATVMHEPELFIVIANFPEPRIEHWVVLLRARAIENQAYVMGVNRIGKDPLHQYSGRSVIVDPHGQIIAEAGARAGVISADLDVETLRKYRKELPFLKDLRSNDK